MRKQLQLHGSFRQLDESVVHSCSAIEGDDRPWQFQSQESWLGMAATPLGELLQHFQRTELMEITVQNTFQHVEVYVASHNTYQALRWYPLGQEIQNGRYLLRSRNMWGQYTYSFGEIERGQLKKQSHTLDYVDIRRLCYALDYAAGVPTRVVWNKQKRILTFFSELPAYERKRLALLGSIQENPGGQYYPRVWYIVSRHEQMVEKMLEDLHVSISLE